MTGETDHEQTGQIQRNDIRDLLVRLAMRVQPRDAGDCAGDQRKESFAPIDASASEGQDEGEQIDRERDHP